MGINQFKNKLIRRVDRQFAQSSLNKGIYILGRIRQEYIY